MPCGTQCLTVHRPACTSASVGSYSAAHMLWAVVTLALVSGASFVFYGYGILSTAAARDEFERYGVPGYRRFVGSAQLLGGLGVLIGLVFAPLGAASAAGLTLMMCAGLIIRFRIHDAARLMLPAASLGAINAVLTALFIFR